MKSWVENPRCLCRSRQSVTGLALIIFGVFNQNAFAWGKRGHQIVGETAAALVSLEPGGEFFKTRQYDFGYYNNVPDFVWKRPATFGKERFEHYLNLEVFHRAFEKQPKIKKPFDLSRAEFEKKFPNVPKGAGRAIWRIRELSDQLQIVTEKLKDPALVRKERQSLQERWLSLAGPMGHYVADLSQPLHVTENHDGQLTNQKGLHHYFEAAVVDALYPSLLISVQSEAKSKWDKYKKQNEKKSITEVLNSLSKESFDAVGEVLVIDKKSERKDLEQNALAYQEIINKRLVAGTLALAEIYRRHLGWKFDGRRFYFFASEPDFIAPGE